MYFAPSCSGRDSRGTNRTVSFHAYPYTNTGQVGVTGSYANSKKQVEVPCGPLTPVLQDLFPRIDFLSLDVEGAEYLVMSNLDLDAIHIDVIIVESRNYDCRVVCEKRKKVRKIFQAQGYLWYDGAITRSDLFVHPDSQRRPPIKRVPHPTNYSILDV